MDPVAVHGRGEHLLDLAFSFPPIEKADPFGFPLPSMAPHADSSGLIESDDDFGEFEFVPANAFDADRSSISFPGVSVSDSARDPQRLLSGARDLFEVPSNAHHTSVTRDLFGLSNAATAVAHFPAKIENNNIELFDGKSWKLDSDVNSNNNSNDFSAQISSVNDVSSVSDKGNGNTVADIAISLNNRPTNNKTISGDFFGDFLYAPSADEVTSGVTTSGVHGTAVQEDFFVQFPGTSDFQSSRQSANFERGNEKQLEVSSDDDWGDFVEHSTLAVNGNLQRFGWIDTVEYNNEDYIPNTTSSMKDSRIPSGLALYDVNNPSNVNGNNNLFPERVAGDDVAGQASESSVLPRTHSENLVSQKRKGSLIDLTSAPIPLSLFGEEESRDGPLQPHLQTFSGHSRAKSLSNPLPLARGLNLTDLIASLYTVPKPESKENAASHLNKEDKELDQNLSNVSSFSIDEECLFDLTLASSLNQCENGSVLNIVSVDDKLLFLKAWADVLAVCESELEHASNVWKQAHTDGLELALLADDKGKNYFAAIGQIYVVVLILASTANVYKPWLTVASKESQNILASLQGCKLAWVHANLREAVQFSLNAVKNTLPSSVVSWEGIQDFPSHAKNVCIQAANVSEHLDPVCKLSLLPFIPFQCTGLRTVQWYGFNYFLPLANIWANYVSNEPPVLPCLQWKSAK